jgi:hypothetical protein
MSNVSLARERTECAETVEDLRTLDCVCCMDSTQQSACREIDILHIRVLRWSWPAVRGDDIVQARAEQAVAERNTMGAVLRNKRLHAELEFSVAQLGRRETVHLERHASCSDQTTLRSSGLQRTLPRASCRLEGIVQPTVNLCEQMSD